MRTLKKANGIYQRVKENYLPFVFVVILQKKLHVLYNPETTLDVMKHFKTLRATDLKNLLRNRYLPFPRASGSVIFPLWAR